MHSYGNWPDELFGDVSAAAEYIGRWLRQYGRINVRDYKEKFGTVRVYCSIGFDQFYNIFFPGYCWIKPWWPNKLDHWLSYKTPLLKWINAIAVPKSGSYIQVCPYIHLLNFLTSSSVIKLSISATV